LASQAAETLITQVRELINSPQTAGISIASDYAASTDTLTPPAGTLADKDGNFVGLFTLPDGRKAVTIDSWGSQANRFEKGLKDNAEALNYPLITLVDAESGEVHGTSLDWSHRHADATWRLAQDDARAAGIPFDDIRDATVANAGALLRYFPNSVLFGWWDSHVEKDAAKDKAARGKWAAAKQNPADYDRVKGHGRAGEDRRSSRIITSEIIAKGVEVRQRFAARVDTLFGPVKDKQSDFGFGSLPPLPGPRDVTFQEVSGRSFISLSYLRRFNFGPDDENGKVAVVLLALAGVAGAANDLHLRSGTDLILRSRTVNVERHGCEPAALDADLSIDTVAEALSAVSAAFGWAPHQVPVGESFRRVVDTARANGDEDTAQ
jgi:CRISPR-associated protein Csb1